MNFIEGDMSKKDLDIINKNVINSDIFPWYYCAQTVTTAKDPNKHPCFTHILLPRHKFNKDVKINSSCYYFFEKIFKSFCEKNKIKVNNILRANINLQTYFKEKMGEPHVDHDFPHKVCIMYLNTVTKGSTYVFKEKIKTKKYNLLKEIKNKAGKIIIIPGEHYHSAGHCGETNEKKITCVFSFN